MLLPKQFILRIQKQRPTFVFSAPMNPTTTTMSPTTVGSNNNINGRGLRGPPGQKGEPGRNVCPIGNL